jgi:hypothetical protein
MRSFFLRLSVSLDTHYWPCLLKRFRILILLDPASFSNFHSYNGGSVHSLSLSVRLISDVRGQRNEGKESFSSQQWRWHQCLFGFIGNPSIVPNKSTHTVGSFRYSFLIIQNWPIQLFMKHIQLYIISAYVLIFEITGYWQVKEY